MDQGGAENVESREPSYLFSVGGRCRGRGEWNTVRLLQTGVGKQLSSILSMR